MSSRHFVFAAIAAAMLAGCGRAGRVDSGGLTAGDRAAAQKALDLLQPTAIPTTLLSISQTAGAVPKVCRVHRREDGTYDLFIFWKPYDRQQAYAWLNGSVTQSTTNDHFHVGYAAGTSSGKQLLRRTQGNAYMRPYASCQIESDGLLRLVPPTGA